MNEKMKYIRFSEIKPKGWMLEQMKRDLKEGFLGHLDELVPDLIIKDNIYGENRLSPKVRQKDVGSMVWEPGVEAAHLWWNSETQSNWWDGFLRTAFLIEDEDAIHKAKAYVSKILSSQDEDGYLGIYSKDMRFQFNSENGELWAQSSLFRGLIGYYEATGVKDVLVAVERAVEVMMKAYPVRDSVPFAGDGHGVCHGLTITDSLERLYQLTGKEVYVLYAQWLYENYCNRTLCEEDIQIKNLLNAEYRFKGHGAHTYEHLRSLTTACYASGDPVLMDALDQYLSKLDTYLTPSGGPIGDEWIHGNTAHTTNTGYEYCSIQELLDSYSLLLQKTRQMKFADRIEWLLFNAGQGARHPHESSIAYLKSDNSYAMEGVFHEKQVHCSEQNQMRYMYSPTHQKTAVCCVPNAGRVYPYFVKSMFMVGEEGILALLYGPCKLETQIQGVLIKIEQETEYPFKQNVKFRLETEKPLEFSIALRKPSWTSNMNVECKDASVIVLADQIILRKTWKSTDEINLFFEAEVKADVDKQGDIFISRGPILYALPLKSREEVVMEFAAGKFRELRYSRDQEIPFHLHFTDSSLESASLVEGNKDKAYHWGNVPNLMISLFNQETGVMEEVALSPIGNTLLRKVTFPKYSQLPPVLS